MSKPNKSHLFIAYNASKPFVRAGTVDGKRLNRALGIAQSSRPRPYTTTDEDCDCPDRNFRLRIKGQPCKHMLALALLDAITGPQEAA